MHGHKALGISWVHALPWWCAENRLPGWRPLLPRWRPLLPGWCPLVSGRHTLILWLRGLLLVLAGWRLVVGRVVLVPAHTKPP